METLNCWLILQKFCHWQQNMYEVLKFTYVPPKHIILNLKFLCYKYALGCHNIQPFIKWKKKNKIMQCVATTAAQNHVGEMTDESKTLCLHWKNKHSACTVCSLFALCKKDGVLDTPVCRSTHVWNWAWLFFLYLYSIGHTLLSLASVWVWFTSQ